MSVWSKMYYNAINGQQIFLYKHNGYQSSPRGAGRNEGMESWYAVGFRT